MQAVRFGGVKLETWTWLPLLIFVYIVFRQKLWRKVHHLIKCRSRIQGLRLAVSGNQLGSWTRQLVSLDQNWLPRSQGNVICWKGCSARRWSSLKRSNSCWMFQFYSSCRQQNQFCDKTHFYGTCTHWTVEPLDRVLCTQPVQRDGMCGPSWRRVSHTPQQWPLAASSRCSDIKTWLIIRRTFVAHADVACDRGKAGAGITQSASLEVEGTEKRAVDGHERDLG